MKLKKLTAFLTAALTLVSVTVPAGTVFAEEESAEVGTAAVLPYQDTTLSFEERAADLVARMTLEEKAAQTAAKSTPGISRLGVHAYYYWREGIHGVARQGGATSFPSSLAMSNTWDRDLMYEIMDITSTEARGKNNKYDLNYWNPTINMARDPRWGRNEESYGEDPYLTTQIAGAAVKGMEGTDEKYKKTISTLKHYAANNCEGERQTGTSIMNERTMREYYSRAFGDIIEAYNPGAVMSSYNGTTIYRNGEILEARDGQKIDYIASSANSYLLSDLLRRAYGFEGFVVGDCGAWDNVYGRAPLRKKLYPNENLDDITATMTVSKIIGAGSSLDCNSGGNGTAQVLAAVKEGLISEEFLDVMVYELFLQRMKTGEFDTDVAYQKIDPKLIESDAHVAKAEEAAEETWVLLENKNNALPLTASASNIAVVGNRAGQVILGDYSADMDQMKSKLVSPIDGITSEIKKINPNATVNLIGNISDTTPLFNIKSITLVKSTGKNTTLDLSTVKTALNMDKADGELKNITKAGTAIIPNVDFKDVTDIRIEASSLPGMPNVSVAIGYGSASQNAANVSIANTSGADDYKTNTGVYNGATGGYTETRDMYITVSASADFSVDNYKSALDAADVIIAYGGTTTDDSSESNDRASIDLPKSESHVQQICDVYGDKTIVVLQTVGQVNVEGFKDKCAALLWTSYNGQTQGEALGKVLTGEVNPSGKLSTTWYTKADLDKMPIGSAKQKIDGIEYNFTNYELASDINNPGADYPGRTYQYYSGTPVYPFGYGKSYTTFEYSDVTVDKQSADANDTVTVTAKVRNTGSKAGTEVAQLYVSVPGADGKNIPLKQLKGFERVELNAGEEKTVTFELNVADVYFFDEATQKNYVIQGGYTAAVGGSSNADKTCTFNVSGTLSDAPKRVTVIPSGIKVYLATDASGEKPAVAGNSVDAGATVVLKNGQIVSDFAANGITMSYQSSDNSVASVDANGIVTAGTKEGTATITVTASKGGEEVKTSFPVVMQTTARMSDSKKAEYLGMLEAAYKGCVEEAYTAEDWALINSIYNEMHEKIENAAIEGTLSVEVAKAVEEIKAVPKISLTEAYTIASVNPNVLVGGVIDYSAEGIGEYKADTTSISGTFTVDNPCTVELEALNGGAKVDSNIVWSVEQLDGSAARRDAEIDINSGVLKLYENGIFKVTANDYANGKSGSATIYANLQIEGESADASGGAKLDDVKEGASGGGKNAGNTNAYWLRFDGVKLDRLTEITFRVSQKDVSAPIKVSLMGNSDWIVATASSPITGAWTNWAEVTAQVNEQELARLSLDENGCGTIFVQTNKSNLDYMKLKYNTDDVYTVVAPGGKVGVSVAYDKSAVLAAAYDGDDKITKGEAKEFASAGRYDFGGFTTGDKIKILTWNGLDIMNPLTAPIELTYEIAEPKELLVYNFSDSVFDSFFDTAEGAKLSSGLGMDGDGGWQTDKGGTFSYGGRTYSFTRSLKGGRGEPGARRVWFTPDADGVVTAVFKASDDRYMNIEQDGKTVSKYGDNTICGVQMNVKGGIPVYVYGGGSNKTLYAVLFEAGKSGTEPTPPPEKTEEPTPPPAQTFEPFDPADIIAKFNVEFESCAKKWAKEATTGNIVENTRDGDIFYFGPRDMNNLAEISLHAAIRNDAGTATAEFFAVDVSSVNVDAASATDIGKLLTSENSIGKVTLVAAKNWNSYYDHPIRFSKSGSLGLFVKLNTDGKYCGNLDYMQFTYTNGGSTSSVSSAETLFAENDLAQVSVSGDEITAVDKFGGETKTISFNSEYGKNVAFKKLTNWNDMIAALVCDLGDGSTSIYTSAAGTVWSDMTPEYFAESDEGAPSNPSVTDICAVDDQMYLGCKDGWLITMPPCSKCATLKKVCDFDIESISSDDGKLVLTGGESEQTVDLSDVRQDDIEAEAALALAAEGAKLVDLRSAAEFAAANYEGSLNVPFDEFEGWLSEQSKDDTIIVYCASGLRSAKAMKVAERLGYTKVYNLGSINKIK